jgi:16S rRNA G527 N7-methylase RsmG
MTLSSDIEEFRSLVNRAVDQLDEINSISKTIPDTGASELSRKFAGLMDNLEEVNRQLRSATDSLEELRSRWG